MPYGVRLGNPGGVIGSWPVTDAQAISIENPIGTPVWGVTPAGAPNGQVAASVVIGAGGTITPVTRAGIFAPTANRAGILMAAGTVDGQEFTILNNAAFTLTFDVVANSKVADGVTAVVAANGSMRLTWSAALSLWFHGN